MKFSYPRIINIKIPFTNFNIFISDVNIEGTPFKKCKPVTNHSANKEVITVYRQISKIALFAPETDR